MASGATLKGITVEVIILVAESSDDDCYIAWSPQLRCVRDGASPQVAVAMCKEALEVLFESLVERGTLRDYLADHGYSIEDRPDLNATSFVIKDGSLFESQRSDSSEFQPPDLQPIIIQKETYPFREMTVVP